MAEAAPERAAARRPGHRQAARRDLLRAVPQRRRLRGRARRAARAPPRHRLDAHARRGQRRRRQALAPEGHRPRARRLDPPAALDGRRRRVRPDPARLHGEGQPQGAQARAAGRAQRARPPRQRRRGGRLVLRRALDEHAPPRRSTSLEGPGRVLVLLGGDEVAARSPSATSPACRGSAGAATPVSPTWSAPRTLVVSEAAIEDLATGRGRAQARACRRSRRPHMDARQVLRSPVISEKSYALIAENKYTFRVHSARAQDPDPGRRRGGLRRARDRGAHDEDEVQAQAPRLDVRPHARSGRRPSSSSRPATASSCSRGRRSAE